MSRTEVVVVEDDRIVRREVVARINANATLRVVAECGDLRSAADALERSGATLALLDLQLPDGSGLQLIPIARARGIEVLVLTVSESETNVYEALRAGAGGYLLKAEAMTTVVDSLEVLRDGGAPISPRIARRLLADFRDRAPVAKPVEVLTAREAEVVELFSSGATYGEVASMLGISINTVRQHVRALYEKLHVSSKAEAVMAGLASIKDTHRQR